MLCDLEANNESARRWEKISSYITIIDAESSYKHPVGVVHLCGPCYSYSVWLRMFLLFHLQALHGMASENDGHVICPKTKESFRVDQAEKVYVM